MSLKFRQLLPRLPLSTLLALALCPAALAQGGAGPAATPRTEPRAEQDGQGTQGAQLSERERRAQAYAKLLEGQRYYSELREGRAFTVERLQRMQAAFRRAAELDPTLAEARTALAEVALYMLDDQAQAEREATAAVSINRDNFGAHRVLSRLHTLRSQLGGDKFDRAAAERAVASLREVTRISPNDAEAWALLGELHLALGRQAEAVEALGKWATLPAAIEGRFYQLVTRGRDLNPASANARLAEVYLRMKRPAEALAAVRRALAIEPDNQRHLELLGTALDAAGTSDPGVFDDLRGVVSQQPQNVAAVTALARAQSRAGRMDEAAATLRAGVEAQRPQAVRERARLTFTLAETYEAGGRFSEAAAAYEELLKIQNLGEGPPATPEQRGAVAELLRRVVTARQKAGQADLALAAVERMRRLLGDDEPVTYLERVRLLRAERRPQEALDVIRTARQRFPDNFEVLQAEAETLTELNRADDAVALLRSRLKGDAGDFRVYYLLGGVQLEAGRAGDAVASARKALELIPAGASALTHATLFLLSSAQERAGDARGSEESLRRVLASDPDNATALNNLGYFLVERGERLDEALEMIRRAVRAEPTNASFLDSLGWAHFKLGQLEDAERYLSEAARRNPTSPVIQEHLGDLFRRLGQNEKARAAWQKALTLTNASAGADRIRDKLKGTAK
ncbi:MAG TPA: tetratricopeptide repeat protein [Pyrinomonadaceae bacterium]|nr:tetratricopeptide repeat protein [Pyrinomonadaceae bacterium]